MGYGIFPDLKDEKVVCQDGCQHTDCQKLRDMNTDCKICGKEVLAGDKHFGWGDDLEHALCVWEREGLIGK